MWNYVGFGILVVVLVLLVWFVAKRRERIQRFYGEVAIEMEKTTWPTRDEVISSTSLVLCAIVFCTLAVWGVDFVIGGLVSWMFAA